MTCIGEKGAGRSTQTDGEDGQTKRCPCLLFEVNDFYLLLNFGSAKS